MGESNELFVHFEVPLPWPFRVELGKQKERHKMSSSSRRRHVDRLRFNCFQQRDQRCASKSKDTDADAEGRDEIESRSCRVLRTEWSGFGSAVHG